MENVQPRWKRVVGWYGVAAILTAFVLTSWHSIAAGSIWYSVLNATGAIGVLIEAWGKKDWEPVVLNLVWAVVAVLALWRA